MEVTELTKSGRVPDRWYLKLQNGDTIKVTLNQIADFSLYKGRELSEEELSELRKSASLSETKARAMRMLSARQMSERELRDRLKEKSEPEENTEEAIRLMESIGALNDEEYAKSIVRSYYKKGYGIAKIKSELIRRGIPKELWEDALEQMGDTTETAYALIERRLGGREPDEREVKRLTDMLLRRGFSWGEVKSALGRYSDALEEID